MLGELARRGLAVLMISSELPEVLGIADRVLVMREGRLVAGALARRRHAGADHARRHRPGVGGVSVVERRRRPPPVVARAAHPADARPAPARDARRRRPARRALGTSLSNSRFLSVQGRTDLMLAAAITGMVAIGQTFVLVMRKVDLSVGSTLGLAAYVAGDSDPRRRRRPAGQGVRDRHRRRARASASSTACWSRVLDLPALVVTLGHAVRRRRHPGDIVGGNRITPEQLPDDVIRFGVDRSARNPEADVCWCSSSARSRRSTCAARAPAATSTPWAATRRPRSSSASPSVRRDDRRPTWSAAPAPAPPACSSWPASAASTPPPARASSCP